MKKLFILLTAVAISNAAFGQVGSTVSEGSKATAEKTKQAGDEVKGSVASEPKKSMDKSKAAIHKAKAHHHAKAAKQAGENIGH